MGLPLLILSSATLLLQGFESGTNKRVRPVIERLAQPADTLMIGNSVTLAGVDHGRLGAASGAVSGGQPAHWIATLQRAGEAKRVVLYVSPLSYDDGRLEDPDDQEAFVHLLIEPDPELSDLALPPGVNSLWSVAKRNRVGARRGLVELAAKGPVELVYRGHVDPALGRLFPEEAGPNEEQAEALEALDDPEAKERTFEPWPTAEVLDASLMPVLVDRVHAHGARLVVVIPAGQGTFHCSDELAPARAWWAAQPVDVVDLSTETWPPDTFSGDWHATPQGRDRITRALSERLQRLSEVPPDAPGRQVGRCF